MDAELIKKAISEGGVFFTDDAEVGRAVEVFAAKRYPIQTEEGLAFLQTILSDKVRGLKPGKSYLTCRSVFAVQSSPISNAPA